MRNRVTDPLPALYGLSFLLKATKETKFIFSNLRLSCPWLYIYVFLWINQEFKLQNTYLYKSINLSFYSFIGHFWLTFHNAYVLIERFFCEGYLYTWKSCSHNFHVNFFSCENYIEFPRKACEKLKHEWHTKKWYDFHMKTVWLSYDINVQYLSHSIFMRISGFKSHSIHFFTELIIELFIAYEISFDIHFIQKGIDIQLYLPMFIPYTCIWYLLEIFVKLCYNLIFVDWLII